MTKTTILIAGGTGFIGAHLIKKLKKKKWNIICISLKNKIKNKNSRITALNFNIKNKDIIFKKLNKYKIDFIVNLAGHINHYEKKKTYESHYIGCKNLVDLAIKKKIKKFIQIGSSVEYGFSKSPISENKKIKIKELRSIYAKSKLKSSKYLLKISKEKNLKYIILRPFLIYGPGQSNNRLIPNTIINCLKNKNFSCSNGNQARDFLYIDDFINLVIKSIENENVNNKIFNAATGKPLIVKQIINKIKKIIKKGKPIFGKIPLRKDEPLKLYADIKNAYKYLNWKPKKTLSSGLRQTIKYYKNTKINNNLKNK